jgi:hypothetical protein
LLYYGRFGHDDACGVITTTELDVHVREGTEGDGQEDLRPRTAANQDAAAIAHKFWAVKVAPPWLYFGAVPDAGYQRLIVFIAGLG